MSIIPLIIGNQLTTTELAFIQNISGLSYATGDMLYRNTTVITRLPIGTANQVLAVNAGATAPNWVTLGAGSGTVTSVSVVTANGISGTVATATTTPAITLTLGSITPSAIQVSGLTASEIVGTDASKNLVSLAVATYPSLTELTYVKGVTSAIQTQMNLKAPLASPTFTGTVVIPTPFTLGATSVTSTGTQLNYLNAATGTTGTASTNVVFSTSPTLVTPVLGVATATSVNKVAITAPATSATLTLIDGTTLTGPASSGTAMTLGNAETVVGVKTFNDGSVKLSGSSSGASTLKAPAVASTYVHTLPAQTTTLDSYAETTEASNATPTVAIAGLHHTHTITALAAAATLGAPTIASGSLIDSNHLIIRIKDNATARALTWNAIFRASSDLALPSTTVLSKTLYVGFKYNLADTKWDLLAVLNNF